jgi:hypothetical protein
MFQSRTYKIVVITLLAFFFLGLGATSIGHIIKFWKISNSWYYAEILAAGNALGIISSIMILFFPKEYNVKYLGYGIFFLTFLIEAVGNVFYNFITMNPTSSLYMNWLDMLKPIVNPYDAMIDYPRTMRSMTALLQGLWIPFTHIFVFGALSKILEHFNDEFIKTKAENTPVQQQVPVETIEPEVVSDDQDDFLNSSENVTRKNIGNVNVWKSKE